MINDQIPQIKYKILDKLNKTVYARKSFKLVDTSLFGCDPVPAFYGGFSQRWLILGSLSISNAYRTGTFFNCTQKPQSDILARLMAAPCLECGETKNLCYFYNGFMDPIPNCRPFLSSIPNELFNNLTGAGNLRRALQEGFEAEWDSVCGVDCMDVTGGRCGFMDENERTLGKELCFCSSGVHRQNCSDGTSIAKRGSRTFGRTRVKLLAGFALGLAFMFGCVCFAYIRRRKMLKNKMELRGKDEQALRHHLDSRTTTTSIETFLQDYASGMPTRFSYKQIKKYSNNFHHKLGQGGFGSVFKAELPNNCTVAIKILDENEQSEIQFLNEVQSIGQIHHQHLVRLLGFCFEKSRRALIYEFMENGSLEKYIHPKAQDNQQRLSWNQLHDIALGTARGIAYLHEECRSRILHCDIKPHNILLDEKFQPKVSDFGLAQMINRENNQISLMRGRGTPGYAPPEMWWKSYGPVSEKSDVYSFGMVLLEMAGERRNFNDNMSRSSETYFPEWVYSHHVVQGSNGGGSKWHKCEGEEEENIARRMELVGLWCIQYSPSRRPTMRNVINMLQGDVSIDIPPLPFKGNALQHAAINYNPTDNCDDVS